MMYPYSSFNILCKIGSIKYYEACCEFPYRDFSIVSISLILNSFVQLLFSKPKSTITNFLSEDLDHL